MDNQKSFCTNCKKEVADNVKLCECGGHNFVYGNLKVEDNLIKCQCGSTMFKTTSHMDFTEKAVTSMACTECGNVCGVETYRTEDDMMYWMDDGMDEL